LALSFANKKPVKRYALNRLLVVSTLVAALAASVLFAFFKMGRVLGVIIPMFFVFSINGIIASCPNAAALDSVPQEIKARPPLLSALQYGSGILAFCYFCAMLADVFSGYATSDVLGNSSVCLAKRARRVF